MTVTVDVHTRVYTGNNALLPGSQVPQPATVLVSAKTGKIIEVHAGRLVRTDYPEITDDHWLEVDDDKYLLPGLVEYVQSRPVVFACPITRVNIISARMYTLTNPDGRTGRDSGQALVQQHLGGSPRLWTCHSTRSRRRPQWIILRLSVMRRARSAGQMSHSGVV